MLAPHGGQTHLIEFGCGLEYVLLKCGLIVDSLEKIGVLIVRFSDRACKADPLLLNVSAPEWNAQDQEASGLQYAKQLVDCLGVACFSFNVLYNGHRIYDV